MIHYQLDCHDPHQQYISFKVRFTATESQHEVQLPSWRPGRYELGNFAKNLRHFKVFADGKFISVTKITKDRWIFDTEKDKEYEISYQYYAADLNAGSTFLNGEQLYVNPVNCFIYVEGMQNLAAEIQLNVPDKYQVATGLKTEGKKLFAANFDELADSPFIASASLKHDFYEVQGVKFNLWFQGECQPDFERLKIDFSKFTQKQFQKFSIFPFEEYHFYFQIVPYKAYHGVEHLNSTVILLGPSFDLFEGVYPDLLGVSSHELYHAWNVKAIRPIELFPYDYTKENYSRLGYLCEGVTTYMGDLFLYRSGVFTIDEYFNEFNKQLQKHFDNFARFNMSVTEASFDTWLDGYVPGAPNRKVSIYTEGCLLAFVLDVMMLKHTAGKHKLDDVMWHLYYDFYEKNKGVSDDDFWKVVSSYVGDKLDYLREEHYNNTKNYEAILVRALDELGLEIEHHPVAEYSGAKLGFKTTPGHIGMLVKAIYPGSPADLGRLMIDDEIIGVNGKMVNHQLEHWLNYYDTELKHLTIIRKQEILQITLPEVNRYFYVNYSVNPIDNPINQQQAMFRAWSN